MGKISIDPARISGDNRDSLIGSGDTQGTGHMTTMTAYHIAEGIDVSPAQRTIIERLGLEVTENRGSIVVVDPFVTERFGDASGKRIVANGDIDAALTELDEAHGLAVKNAKNTITTDDVKRAPAAPASGKVQGRTVAAVGTAHNEEPAPNKTATPAKGKKAAAAAAKSTPAPKGKTTAEATTAEAKPLGKIETLVKLLEAGGGTQAELYAGLVKAFPEAATESGGMRTTIQIQLKALKEKKKLDIQKKGEGKETAVYFIPAKKK